MVEKAKEEPKTRVKSQKSKSVDPRICEKCMCGMNEESVMMNSQMQTKTCPTTKPTNLRREVTHPKMPFMYYPEVEEINMNEVDMSARDHHTL